MAVSRVAVFIIIVTCLQVCSGFQNPSRKTWWAKRVVTDDFYTAGRLSDRQIKYASESGFRSVVSLMYYESEASGLPSSEQARVIA